MQDLRGYKIYSFSLIYQCLTWCNPPLLPGGGSIAPIRYLHTSSNKSKKDKKWSLQSQTALKPNIFQADWWDAHRCLSCTGNLICSTHTWKGLLPVTSFHNKSPWLIHGLIYVHKMHIGMEKCIKVIKNLQKQNCIFDYICIFLFIHLFIISIVHVI